jgi:two-component system response regulator RegX3
VNASSTQTAILVVEDEAAIRRGLCDALAFRGFAPESAERGDDGLRSALQGSHALIILDLMLPGLSGFDVCRELRAAGSATPVLMLTARGSEEDVLRGFACGADDYVTKPFSVAQLLARVEAILRRVGGASAEAPPEPFGFGPWQIDPAAFRARGKGGQELELTRRELDLLRLFAREEGRIVARRLLLREIWGYTDPDRVETRTVDMHVAKLRRKLDPVDGPSLLETVRGEGYRYGSPQP